MIKRRFCKFALAFLTILVLPRLQHCADILSRSIHSHLCGWYFPENGRVWEGEDVSLDHFCTFSSFCFLLWHICVGVHQNTVWCSEIGSLTSLDACNSGASSDVREPISLHQAVCYCRTTNFRVRLIFRESQFFLVRKITDFRNSWPAIDQQAYEKAFGRYVS